MKNHRFPVVIQQINPDQVIKNKNQSFSNVNLLNCILFKWRKFIFMYKALFLISALLLLVVPGMAQLSKGAFLQDFNQLYRIMLYRFIHIKVHPLKKPYQPERRRKLKTAYPNHICWP